MLNQGLWSVDPSNGYGPFGLLPFPLWRVIRADSAADGFSQSNPRIEQIPTPEIVGCLGLVLGRSKRGRQIVERWSSSSNRLVNETGRSTRICWSRRESSTESYPWVSQVCASGNSRRMAVCGVVGGTPTQKQSFFFSFEQSGSDKLRTVSKEERQESHKQ